MAQALKASSQAFSNSLESEKDILGRATEGLDKNTSGLEAASKRMGYLRRMTEGEGLVGADDDVCVDFWADVCSAVYCGVFTEVEVLMSVGKGVF